MDLQEEDIKGTQGSVDGGQDSATPEPEIDAGGIQSAPADYEETRRERDQFRVLAQRVQADFVNYRKRTEAEREEFRRKANRDLLLRLLTVLDGLDLALAEDASRDVDQKWVEGVRAVKRSLDSVLGPEGVEAFGRPGDHFDPRLHEAIARVPAADLPPDTVLKVHRPGYRLHGDVIRPAMVEIAASPPDDTGGQ
jgi:molecular chaperone GrpE